MSGVSVLYKSCAAHLAKLTALLNLNALTTFLRLQATEWEYVEPCE